MMSVIGKILTKIETFFNALAGVAIIGMMLLVSADTIFRYFLKKPIHGVTEIVSCYLSIILVYLSISYCYRKGGHVKVTLLSQIAPAYVMRIINSITGVASTAFFLLITVTNITSMKTAYVNGTVPGGVVNTPIWPGYLVLVIGAALMTLRLVLNTILVILDQKDPNITPAEGK